MDEPKEFFFTIEGKPSLERLVISHDCCVKDFIDDVTKQHGIENTGDFKMFQANKDDTLPDDTPVIQIPDNTPVDQISDVTPVHVGKCTNINVKIHYTDKTYSVTVSPDKPISYLLALAVKHFDHTDFKNKDYELAITATEQQPDKSLPIGAFVGDNTCSIEMNLVPSVKLQG